MEFEEFCKLSAKFLVDEDPEGMKKELKEAFRIYDKGPFINDVITYSSSPSTYAINVFPKNTA